MALVGNPNRVAIAQGKQGIWFLVFPDRENTGNFVLTQGKSLLRQGKYLNCDCCSPHNFVCFSFHSVIVT